LCVRKFGRKATFENDIRELCKGGSVDLGRAKVLHCAVECGVCGKEDLRLLVSLGASVHGTDEFGNTPLHNTSHLLGQSEALQASAVRAAESLLALGADRRAVNIFGHKAIDSVLFQIREYDEINATFDFAQRIPWNGRDDSKHAYELVIVLLEEPERQALWEGVLTPRQKFRLEWYAETRVAECDDVMLAKFTNNVPQPSEEMAGQVPMWEHIPLEVRGTEVYKSFVHGWAQIVRAIGVVVKPRSHSRREPALPTVENVSRELWERNYDQRYTSHFLSRGGKVEFALDALLYLAKDADEMFWSMEEDEDKEDDYRQQSRYEALPKHRLDDCWEFVRYKLLGPNGKVKKGPF